MKARQGKINENVYCTPIDRALKMRFNEGSDSSLRTTILDLFFGQTKCTNIRRF